jgi:hypothetical protein
MYGLVNIGIGPLRDFTDNLIVAYLLTNLEHSTNTSTVSFLLFCAKLIQKRAERLPLSPFVSFFPREVAKDYITVAEATKKTGKIDNRKKVC